MSGRGQHPDLLSDAEKQRRKERGLQIIMSAAQYATENISRILGEDAENNPDYLSGVGQFQPGTNYFADVPPVQNMAPMISTRGGISPEQVSYTVSQTSTSSSYQTFGISNSHSDFATSTSSSYQTFENSNSHSDLIWPSQSAESHFRSDTIQSHQSPSCISHSQSMSPFIPTTNMGNDDDDSDSDIICLDPPVTDQGNFSNPLISSSMNGMNNNIVDPHTPTSLSDFGSDYAANSPMSQQMPQQFIVNPQPTSSRTSYLYPNSLSATSYANFSLSGSTSSSNQQQQNNIFQNEPSILTIYEVWKDPIISELLEKYVKWSIDFPYTNGGVKMFCEKVNERAFEMGWRNPISKETLYSKASKLRRKLKKQKEQQQQENGHQLVERTSNQQLNDVQMQDPNTPYHQEEQQPWNFGGTHTYGMVGMIGAEQFLSGNEGRNEEQDEEAPELAPENEQIDTPTAVINAQVGNGAEEEPRNEQDTLEEENNGEDEWTIGQQLITDQGKIDLDEDFDWHQIDTPLDVRYNARIEEDVEESGNEQDAPEEEIEEDERQVAGQQNTADEGNNDVDEEVEAGQIGEMDTEVGQQNKEFEHDEEAQQIGEMDMETGHQIEHFDLNAAFEQIDAQNYFDDVARNRFKSWPDNFVRDQQKRYAAGLQTAKRSKPFKKNKGATNIGWIRKFVRVPPEIGHQQLHGIHPEQIKIDNRIMDVLEAEMEFAAFEEQMKTEPRSEFDEEHACSEEDDDEYELIPDENSRCKSRSSQQKPEKPKNTPQKNKAADGGKQKEERRKNRGPLFKYSTQKLWVEVEPMTDLEGLVANLNLHAWPVDSANLGGTDQPSTSASSSHHSAAAIKSKKRKRKRSARSPTPETTRQSRQRKFDPGVLDTCRDMLSPKVAKSLGGLPTCKLCGKEFSRAKYPGHMLIGHQIYVSDNKEVLEHLDTLPEHAFKQIGWRCEPCQDQDFIEIETYLAHCDSETHKARAGQASKSKKWTLGEWYYGKKNNN